VSRQANLHSWWAPAFSSVESSESFDNEFSSASFIPVYANLLARHDEKDASRVASAVFSLLALVTSIVVVAGILAAPLLTSVIAFGFEGERRDLVIHLVRIFFPGAGLLVLSAWCLGVLNSHRKFFLSYTAPVVWNLAIIFSLVVFGGLHPGQLNATALNQFQFR
jgi:putative peptidoglycan lipid II flippase